MKSAAVLATLVLWMTTVSAQAPKPAASQLDVYKSATCGCCSKWVEHMRQAGFTVKVTEKSDDELDAFKTTSGVPRTAQSCHTAIAGGYVIEGHVPAADVRRLLKERPAIAGIAVPGMPTGSPGMEVPGVAPAAYKVVAFDKQGAVTVFSSYPR
jgi:hypothetical protein